MAHLLLQKMRVKVVDGLIHNSVLKNVGILERREGKNISKAFPSTQDVVVGVCESDKTFCLIACCDI